MYPKSLETLIECFKMLPGVGTKSAQRYALLMLEKSDEEIQMFAQALIDAKNNIKDVIKLGRNRWKIENEGFYNQKHRTFNITHLNSRNDTAMKNHYFFIQFAHTIRQLLEQGNLLTKSLKLKIKEVSRFLLDTLTSTISDLNNLETKFQLRFDT